MRLLVAIFTALPIFFIGMGIQRAMDQQRYVIAAKPVQAIMESSTFKIDAKTDSKHRRTVTYEPAVSYIYTVDGQTYRSTRAFPTRTQTSKETAEKLTTDFPVGRTVTAWYAPSNPAIAHLIHETEFGPYLLILFPMLHLSVGLGLIAVGVGRRPRKDQGKPIPVPGKEGWFELPIHKSLIRRKKPWPVITIAWYLVGLAVAVHYFGFVPKPWDPISYISLGVYALIGLIPIYFWIRYTRLTKGLRDVRIWADTSTFTLGRSFRVRSEQSFKLPLSLTEYKLGLICDKTEKVEAENKKRATPRTTVDYESWSPLDPPPSPTPTDNRIENKQTLTPPKTKTPSTPPEDRTLPNITWRITLIANFKDHPTYRADFPITVKTKGDQ